MKKKWWCFLSFLLILQLSSSNAVSVFIDTRSYCLSAALLTQHSSSPHYERFNVLRKKLFQGHNEQERINALSSLFHMADSLLRDKLLKEVLSTLIEALSFEESSIRSRAIIALVKKAENVSLRPKVIESLYTHWKQSSTPSINIITVLCNIYKLGIYIDDPSIGYMYYVLERALNQKQRFCGDEREKKARVEEVFKGIKKIVEKRKIPEEFSSSDVRRDPVAKVEKKKQPIKTILSQMQDLEEKFKQSISAVEKQKIVQELIRLFNRTTNISEMKYGTQVLLPVFTETYSLRRFVEVFCLQKSIEGNKGKIIIIGLCRWWEKGNTSLPIAYLLAQILITYPKKFSGSSLVSLMVGVLRSAKEQRAKKINTQLLDEALDLVGKTIIPPSSTVTIQEKHVVKSEAEPSLENRSQQIGFLAQIIEVNPSMPVRVDAMKKLYHIAKKLEPLQCKRIIHVFFQCIGDLHDSRIREDAMTYLVKLSAHFQMRRDIVSKLSDEWWGSYPFSTSAHVISSIFITYGVMYFENKNELSNMTLRSGLQVLEDAVKSTTAKQRINYELISEGLRIVEKMWKRRQAGTYSQKRRKVDIIFPQNYSANEQVVAEQRTDDEEWDEEIVSSENKVTTAKLVAQQDKKSKPIKRNPYEQFTQDQIKKEINKLRKKIKSSQPKGIRISAIRKLFDLIKYAKENNYYHILQLLLQSASDFSIKEIHDDIYTCMQTLGNYGAEVLAYEWKRLYEDLHRITAIVTFMLSQNKANLSALDCSDIEPILNFAMRQKVQKDLKTLAHKVSVQLEQLKKKQAVVKVERSTKGIAKKAKPSEVTKKQTMQEKQSNSIKKPVSEKTEDVIFAKPEDDSKKNQRQKNSSEPEVVSWDATHDEFSEYRVTFREGADLLKMQEKLREIVTRATHAKEEEYTKIVKALLIGLIPEAIRDYTESILTNYAKHPLRGLAVIRCLSQEFVNSTSPIRGYIVNILSLLVNNKTLSDDEIKKIRPILERADHQDDPAIKKDKLESALGKIRDLWGKRQLGVFQLSEYEGEKDVAIPAPQGRKDELVEKFDSEGEAVIEASIPRSVIPNKSIESSKISAEKKTVTSEPLKLKSQEPKSQEPKPKPKEQKPLILDERVKQLVGKVARQTFSAERINAINDLSSLNLDYRPDLLASIFPAILKALLAVNPNVRAVASEYFLGQGLHSVMYLLEHSQPIQNSRMQILIGNIVKTQNVFPEEVVKKLLPLLKEMIKQFSPKSKAVAKESLEKIKEKQPNQASAVDAILALMPNVKFAPASKKNAPKHTEVKRIDNPDTRDHLMRLVVSASEPVHNAGIKGLSDSGLFSDDFIYPILTEALYSNEKRKVIGVIGVLVNKGVNALPVLVQAWKNKRDACKRPEIIPIRRIIEKIGNWEDLPEESRHFIDKEVIPLLLHSVTFGRPEERIATVKVFPKVYHDKRVKKLVKHLAKTDYDDKVRNLANTILKDPDIQEQTLGAKILRWGRIGKSRQIQIAA